MSALQGRHQSGRGPGHDGLLAGVKRRRGFATAVALVVGSCSVGLLMPAGAIAESTPTGTDAGSVAVLPPGTSTSPTTAGGSPTTAGPGTTTTSTGSGSATTTTTTSTRSRTSSTTRTTTAKTTTTQTATTTTTTRKRRTGTTTTRPARDTTTTSSVAGPTSTPAPPTPATAPEPAVALPREPLGAGRPGVLPAPVEGVLAAPVTSAAAVQDDEANVRTATAALIDVLGNDDGLPAGVTLSVSRAPAGGAAQVDGDAISYRSKAGFKGDDSFDYQVSSGGAVLGTATVTVHVLPATGGTVAVDDGAYTTPGRSVLIRVLANDSGAADLDVELPTANTAHGRVALADDGIVRYTPDDGFSGTDSFEYRLSDGGDEVDRAEVTVVVALPAVAVGDGAVAPFGQSVRIPVRANDRNAEGLFTQLFYPPFLGTAVVNADGSITYTAPATYPSGTTPQVTFYYQLTRDAAGTDVVDGAAVVVQLSNGDDDPVASPDFASVSTGSAVTIDVLANDANAAPDLIGRAYLSDDGCETSSGTLRNNGDGTLTWAGTDQPGTYGGCYVLLHEPDGVTADLGRITITVTDDDVAGRMVAVDDTILVRPPAATTFDPRANDRNAEDADVVIDTRPAHGTVSVEDGIVTFRASGDGARSDTFRYHLEYGGEIYLRQVEGQVGYTPSARVDVVIDGPVGLDDQARTVANAPVSVPVLANDTGLDPDGIPNLHVTTPANGTATPAGDAVTYTPRPGFIGTDRFRYSVDLRFGDAVYADVVQAWVTVVVGPPRVADVDLSVDPGVPTVVPIPATGDDLSGFTVVAADPAHGRVTRDGAGRFSYLSDAGYTGPDTFRYSVRLGEDEVAGADVTITVRNPVAADDAAATVTGNAVRIPVKANDTNAGGFTVVAADPGNGSVAVGPDGTVTYTPDPGFPAGASETDTFGYTLLSGAGAEVGSATVAVTVAHLVPQPDSAVTAPGVPVVVDVLANDAPVPPGFAPVIVTGPSAGTAAVTTTSIGTAITYTPSAGFELDSLRYVLQDAAGRRSAPALVQVRLIDAVDDAVHSPHGLPVPVGVLVNDVATGASVVLVGDPAGGTLSAGVAPGLFTFTPGSKAAGSGSFRYGLVVAGRIVDTATVSVTWGAFPVARDDRASTQRNTPVTIDVGVNDDTSATGLGLRIVQAPRHGTITGTTSTDLVGYRPAAGFVGTDTFRYGLVSGNQVLTSATVTVRVTRPVVTTTTTTPTRGPGGGTTTTGDPRPTANPTPTPTPTPIPTPAPRPPVAVDDGASTAPGTPVRIAVVSNDTDGDGDLDPGSVTILAPPAHGTAVVGAGGLVTYTPDEGTEAFTDSFTYQVADALGARDSATVSVQIGALEILQVSSQTVLPGQRIDVTGTGCEPGEPVRFSVDGLLRPPVAAGPDGSFRATLEVSDEIGRHHVRASCNGRAFDSPVDVIQILAAGEANAASAAVALLATVAGLLAFYLLTGSILAGGGDRRRRR